MALFASPYVRSFSFPDAGQRLDGGCAVMVARGEELGSPIGNQDDADDVAWSDAQTAAFLAGEPLTLAWTSPAQRDNQRVYVCCWITIDND